MKAPLAGTSVKMVISLLRPLLFAPVGRFSITVTTEPCQFPPAPAPIDDPVVRNLHSLPMGVVVEELVCG